MRNLVIVGGEPRQSIIQNLKKKLGIEVKWPPGGNITAANRALRLIRGGGWNGLAIVSLSSHAATEAFAEARRKGLPCTNIHKYGISSICRALEEIAS